MLVSKNFSTKDLIMTEFKLNINPGAIETQIPGNNQFDFIEPSSPERLTKLHQKMNTLGKRGQIH